MIFLGALVAFQVLALQLAWAAVVNRTIDDTFGDSETRRLPLFLPSDGEVWKGPSCIGCAILPDTTRAFKNTYQAATYAPDSGKVSITLTFNGACRDIGEVGTRTKRGEQELRFGSSSSSPTTKATV